MPVFSIKQGIDAGEKRVLSTSRIVIGRSPDNDLVLSDECVDLAHVSIEARGSWWVLQDLGSPEGTLINDKMVSGPCRLSSGDLIQLNHDVVLEFQEWEDGQPQTHQFVNDPVIPMPESQLPAKESQSLRGWLYVLMGLTGVLVLVWVVGALFLGGTWFYVSQNNQQNSPPLLESLTPESTITVAPGENVYFLIQARDSQDLNRVEFSVDTKRQYIDTSLDNTVIQMQSLFVWSNKQTGTYVLSAIAFDQANQPSNTVNLTVTVQEP